MNKYIIIVLLALLIGTGGTLTYLKKTNDTLKKDIEVLYNNNFAYEQELISYKDSIIKERGVFNFTLNQINKSKDSVIIKLNQTRKSLNIKDKELKEMTHFIANMKTDTIINITNIINDSCEFDLRIQYNPQTIFEISNKRINGQDSLRHNSSISSSFDGYIYGKKTWKEPNFFKRLFLFRWGKNTTDRGTLIPDNDKIEVKDFRIIRIKE